MLKVEELGRRVEHRGLMVSGSGFKVKGLVLGFGGRVEG